MKISPLAAGTLALLLVASQLAGLLHLAAGRHAVCPEHGELVHVDEHGPGEIDLAPSETESPAWSGAQGPAAPDEHDHCTVAVSRAEPVICAVPWAVAMPAPVVAPATVRPPSTRPRGPGIATWLIAPKQSPPA